MSKVEDQMDTDQYISILSSKLLPYLSPCQLDLEFPVEDELFFQQVNDPKHAAERTMKFLAEYRFKTMRWPAQSPDLNPIEHLWSHLKVKIAARLAIAKGVHELWQIVCEEWQEITADYCKKLEGDTSRYHSKMTSYKILKTSSKLSKWD